MEEQNQEKNPEKDLVELLFSIAENESLIEQFRCSLAENDQFFVNDGFNTIDQWGRGYITSQDLQAFCSYNHIQIQESESEFFIYSNASNKQDLNFQDFLKLVLPRHTPALREMCLDRKKEYTQNQSKLLPFYLEEQMSKIFEFELFYLRKIEQMKLEIMNKYNWNIKSAFDRITKDRTEYINKQNIYEIMKNYPLDYDVEDFKYILCRFDRDNNEKVTVDEFSRMIFPSEFISRNISQKDRQCDFYTMIRQDKDNNIYNDYIQVQNSKSQKKNILQENQYYSDTYRFCNDINENNFQLKNDSQNKNYSYRKFLKTNMQFDKKSPTSRQFLNQSKDNLSVNQNQELENYIQKSETPLLNDYFIDKTQTKRRQRTEIEKALYGEDINNQEQFTNKNMILAQNRDQLNNNIKYVNEDINEQNEGSNSFEGMEQIQAKSGLKSQNFNAVQNKQQFFN